MNPSFSERCQAFIDRLPPDEQLDRLAGMIADAEFDKAAGYGPMQDEINAVRRLWLNLYERHYGRETA